MRGEFRCLVAMVLAVAVSGRAATLRVPDDYASVLAAVDAAVAGDSVLVGPGSWTQTATRMVSLNGQSIPITACAFLKPGITVLATGGPVVTFLQPPAGEGVVHAVSGALVTVLEGFTVTAVDAVVASQNSELEVRDCWLLSNANVAVTVALSGHVTLRNCRIEDNGWNNVGSGFTVLAQSSTVEFYDCEFRNNLGRRAVRVDIGPRVVVDGCTVSGHVTSGAFLFESVPDLQIRNSTFSANKNTGNGGAITAVSSFGVVEFCVFVRDSATWGGGIATSGGSVELTSNTFYACHATVGSAIQVGGNDPGVRNNIISSSTGQYGAVDRTNGLNNAVTGCNIFWANEAPDFSSIGTWTPSSTDIFADPQFCDAASGDLTLHSGSPGAPGVTPACGTIGALGVGCGSVSVESTSWGKIKSQYR